MKARSFTRSMRRRGFTWIELVVVIFITMVAVALLLPATRSTREGARRSDCKNKLKQFGIALLNYHEIHESFPPGWIGPLSPSASENSGFGWGTFLLPHMEQGPLFRGVDFGSFQNQSYATTILPAFRCASDVGDPQDASASVRNMGTSNYVGNFGVGLPALRHHLDGMQGVFGENSGIRFKDIRDGSANVVLLGERRQPAHGTTWVPEQIDGAFNSYWAGFPQGTSPLAIVSTVSTGRHPTRDFGAKRLDKSEHVAFNIKGVLNGIQSHSSKPTAVQTLQVNKLSDGSALSRDFNSPTSAGLNSWHPGGAQILLGDGTVRFISDSIDTQTYINLMRRDDGLKLGEF